MESVIPIEYVFYEAKLPLSFCKENKKSIQELEDVCIDCVLASSDKDLECGVRLWLVEEHFEKIKRLRDILVIIFKKISQKLTEQQSILWEELEKICHTSDKLHIIARFVDTMDELNGTIPKEQYTQSFLDELSFTIQKGEKLFAENIFPEEKLKLLETCSFDILYFLDIFDGFIDENIQKIETQAKLIFDLQNVEM
jgi:hypothetical protein